ncbi:MAG: BCD family MFS transporter [Cyanobacteria bacterium J06621_8]
MTIEDYPQSMTNNRPKRQIGLPTVFRLGLFNMGLGLMAVITLAVLNRVMITELGIPATITGGISAISLLVAPARVWFGQLSDNRQLWGKHRTNYILLGAAIFGSAVFLAVQIVWQLGAVIEASGGWVWNSQTIGWSALLSLVMAIYGLAVCSSSTPFTALLVDITEEETRSRLIAIVWSMLMVGIIVGAISGGIIFGGIETQGFEEGNIPLESLQPPLNSVFSRIPFVVFTLALIATWGVEKRYSRFTSRTSTNREDNITFGNALQVLTTSRQTGIFFTFLSILTIGLFMQEAVLEPYGGDVFGMSIGETTQLNGFWGVGILLGYSFTGFLIIPALGKKLTVKIGCILTAFCFGIIILAGFTQQPQVLQLAMVLFGIAAGIATVGGISLMLDLTVAQNAGTFIGAWGLAQAMSRGIATLLGGIVLDVGKGIFASPLFSYGLVFTLEALSMLLAIAILNQVNIEEFKSNTGKALTTVLEGDLDG